MFYRCFEILKQGFSIHILLSQIIILVKSSSKFPKHFILQIICSNIPPLKVGFGKLCSHLIALDDVNYLMSQQYDGSLLGIINLEAPQLLRKGFKTSKHERPEESGTTPK